MLKRKRYITAFLLVSTLVLGAAFKNVFWSFIYRDAEYRLSQFCQQVQVSDVIKSPVYKDVYVVRNPKRNTLGSGQENAVLNLLSNPPVELNYIFHGKKGVIYSGLFEDPYSLAPERRHVLYFYLELHADRWKVINIYDYDLSNEVKDIVS